jgi:hypothetical protein
MGDASLLPHWIEAFVLRLLLLDGGSNRRFIPPYGGHILATSPEMLLGEIAAPSPIGSGDVDGRFAFDEPDDLRDRILGRNRQQQRHVIRASDALLRPGIRAVRPTPGTRRPHADAIPGTALDGGTSA